MSAKTRETSNVLAETSNGRDDNVVMVGAHLDSVPEGPGIQDNGSGSAAILEVALQMKKVKPDYSYHYESEVKPVKGPASYRSSEIHLLGLAMLKREYFIVESHT